MIEEPQISPEPEQPAPFSEDAPSDTPPARRIPNAAHAAVFLGIAALLLVLLQAILFGPLTRAAGGDSASLMAAHPRRLLGSEAGAYLATLLLSWWLFPRLWRTSFLDGLAWRTATARQHALRLIPLGFVLGFTVAAITASFAETKQAPVDAMFASTLDSWLITIFGITLAPAFEEICFRGFLLPAFAIAYDWFSLPRTPQAATAWRSSTALTSVSLAFSAILSSILFALLHGQQVGFQLPVLLALFTVSMVLALVRIKTRSVACSTLVHSAYNSFVFLGAILQTGGYRHLEKLTQH